MPQRSSISQLPDAVRQALEDRLVAGGFAGYTDLADWLTDQGYEISKSAVHRYGQALERRLAAIKASTQAAQMIAKSAPDEEDSRSAAVLSLVQTDLFNALLDIQEAADHDDDPELKVRLLSQAARAIADVSRASVTQKKFAAEVKKKATQTAEAVEKEAKKGGLSEEAVQAIRKRILGIAE